jgi:site-specific DNA-methyltransferase (adenine-specific)
VFADLPYGTTQIKWDSIIPLDELWPKLLACGHERTAYVFTATQPFTSALVQSNLKMFKYDVVWEKTLASGTLNCNHMPLRNHESVLVFYKRPPTYNEQRTEGEPYRRGTTEQTSCYGKYGNIERTNDGYRHAKSIIKVPNPRIRGSFPTQKPEALVAHFIKCFTNEGDLVLDPTLGSGTTGVVCEALGRKFIGMEKDEDTFALAQERIDA